MGHAFFFCDTTRRTQTRGMRIRTVTHPNAVAVRQNFRCPRRAVARTRSGDQNVPNDLEEINKGMFVAVQFQVLNATWYNLPFVIAQIKQDCTHLDTKNPSTMIEVQIYMPTGHIGPNTDLLTKRFVAWQEDDGRRFLRDQPESNLKSKTLTSQSLQQASLLIYPRPLFLCKSIVK